MKMKKSFAVAAAAILASLAFSLSALSVSADTPIPATFCVAGLQYTTVNADGGTVILNGIDPGNNAALDSNGTLFVPSSVTYDSTTLTVAAVGENGAPGETLSDLPAACTQISLPYTVTKIKAGAFSNCNNLQMIEILSNNCVIESGSFTGADNLDIYCADTVSGVSYTNAVNRVGSSRVFILGNEGDTLVGSMYNYQVITAGSLASPGTVALSGFSGVPRDSVFVPSTVYADGGKYENLYTVTQIAANAFSSYDLTHVESNTDIQVNANAFKAGLVYALFNGEAIINNAAFPSGCYVYVKPDSDAMENYTPSGAEKRTYYGLAGTEFTIGDYTFKISGFNPADAETDVILKSCNNSSITSAQIKSSVSGYDGESSKVSFCQGDNCRINRKFTI
jgi:hypothetical protein